MNYNTSQQMCSLVLLKVMLQKTTDCPGNMFMLYLFNTKEDNKIQYDSIILVYKFQKMN